MREVWSAPPVYPSREIDERLGNPVVEPKLQPKEDRRIETRHADPHAAREGGPFDIGIAIAETLEERLSSTKLLDGNLDVDRVPLHCLLTTSYIQTIFSPDDMATTKLEAARKARKWTQTTLAYRAKVSQSDISAWEHGRRAPGPNQAVRVAKVLDVPAEELLSAAS
jgi:DNA-binding XRE family transcriptional regulator